MQIIGKARINWGEYNRFLEKEKEHAKNREAGWYVEVRNDIPCEIKKIIWDGYEKCGEGRNFPIAIPRESKIKEMNEHQKYLDRIGIEWDLLYSDSLTAVLKSGKLTVGLPKKTVECHEYENLDNSTIAELRGKTGMFGQYPVISRDSSVSISGMKKRIVEKESEINEKKSRIAALKMEKEEELIKIKKELEQKYADKIKVIEEKKAEMEKQLKNLKGQMFLLETEIYSIRCFTGETVDFVQLCKGNAALEEEPVVFYQKLRYLDEEMGRYLSIYNFDGWDFKLFEQALQHREDLRDLFAPGPKSISLIKVSKSNICFRGNNKIANTLVEYEVFHGKNIGILLRDGGNLWIGWTDEEKISFRDGNAFYKPEKKENLIGDVAQGSSSKEEVASRYFIFSILQGVFANRKILRLPEGVNVFQPSPFVIFSMADGWLEDNRYGTFADIVARTDAPLMKGDMVLTTIRICRDDAGIYYGRSTVNDAWNNNRGRGDKNRTHDAHIPDLAVLPVNCIDTYIYCNVYYKKFRLAVETVTDSIREEGGRKYISSHYETTKTKELIGMEESTLELVNWKLYGKYEIKKGASAEEVYQYAKQIGYCRENEYINPVQESESFYTIYDHAEFDVEESHYFISARKTDSNYWGDGKDSYANMEIFHNEYLNLTFLNSVYLSYAIQNRKIGGWKRGNKVIHYADSIPYLNTALQYIRGREKEEAALLQKYMKLYDGWQVELSEWRLKNNYHRLTDARAKKFAKGRKNPDYT